MTMKHTDMTSLPQSIYARRYYFDPSARSVAHGIKEGNGRAIAMAAHAMKSAIPADRPVILVPIPSRKGYATTTLLLAKELQRQTSSDRVRVMDALRGNVRQSLYEAKKQGTGEFDRSWFGFHLTKHLPKDADLLFVDNVESTGATMKAAIAACGRGKGLVYAYDETHGMGISEVIQPIRTTTMTSKLRNQSR